MPEKSKKPPAKIDSRPVLGRLSAILFAKFTPGKNPAGANVSATGLKKESLMTLTKTGRIGAFVKGLHLSRTFASLVSGTALAAVLLAFAHADTLSPNGATPSALGPIAAPNAPAASKLASPTAGQSVQSSGTATSPVAAPVAPAAATQAPNAVTKPDATGDAAVGDSPKPETAPSSALPASIAKVLPSAVSPALPSTAMALPAITDAAADFHNADPRVESMFRSGLLSTLREAATQPDGTIYVGTGDIFAEWLRDSSAQVRPYLFYAKDPAVAAFLRGVIARQVKYILIDPYANAFKADYATDPIHERKFELDSLMYPITLAWTYWKVTGDASIFTPDFQKAMVLVLDTLKAEQDHAQNSKYTHFALSNNGKGPEDAVTGMIWTGFRPSDDRSVYSYLIPAEMMAVVALGDLAEIEESAYHDQAQADRAHTMRQQVHDGIQRYGIVHDAKYGDVYAYEVDGRGNFIVMDDANIPSLLSAPYLGYVKASDQIYQNTRRLILSNENKNYATGKIGSGIGSEHTPKGYIWPLALIMQAMTSTSAREQQDMVNELLASDPGDHLLHESFDPNDPTKLTRKNFGWPNALFAEYLLVHEGGRQPLPVGSTRDLNFRAASK
jgi:meiotically up-regulated gene 157 (Mug157) protein